LTCGRAELFALSWSGLWGGRSLSGATSEHGLEFGNLSVDLSLLVLESYDGGFNDIAVQFRYWHVFLSQSYSHIKLSLQQCHSRKTADDPCPNQCPSFAEIRYAGSMPETMEPLVAAEIKMQFAEVLKSIIEHAGAKTVYGEPVSVEGKTVLPVATVWYGFGGNSGGKGNNWQHGGGGGGGLIAKPLGVVEVTQSQTRFIPIVSSRALLVAVGVGVYLGLLVGSRRRQP
jgi:uncharacterized spore protein YtfJ